jgi:hypothetical protein
MTITVSGKFDITEIVENSEGATNFAVMFINEANLISSLQMTITVSGKFDITAIVENSERGYEFCSVLHQSSELNK